MEKIEEQVKIVEFNPKDKIIISNINDIEYIYSRWKEWMLKDLNAMYLPAFKWEGNEIKLDNDWSILNN
jgi:hypothetical protein